MDVNANSAACKAIEFSRCLSLAVSYLTSVSPLLVVHSIQIALFRLQDCS